MQIGEYLEKEEKRRGSTLSVGFLGVGLTNRALLTALLGRGYKITLRQTAPIEREGLAPQAKVARIYEGKAALDNIDEDILFLSPSVRRDGPELSAAVARGTVLTSDAELFFLDAKGVYAVTGSSGKSTTANIAAHLLGYKYDTALVGNIGIPFTAAPRSERYVAELSSFQLMYLDTPPDRAIITSLSPNHLDWHKDLGEYIGAKTSLIRRAPYSVMSADDELCREYLSAHGADTVYSVRLGLDELKRGFKAKNYITLAESKILLSGEPILDVGGRLLSHNIANLMGAIGLCHGEYTEAALADTLENMPALPHRIELFLTEGGVDYINSSIDTTPERTRTTLLALGRRVRLILGGRGKGLSILPIVPALVEYAEGISLYGEAGREYYGELCSSGILDTTPCRLFEHFDEAAEDAAERALCGEAVLLSPAATGYGEFRSFAERGEHFKEWVIKRAQKRQRKNYE